MEYKPNDKLFMFPDFMEVMHHTQVTNVMISISMLTYLYNIVLFFSFEVARLSSAAVITHFIWHLSLYHLVGRTADACAI